MKEVLPYRRDQAVQYARTWAYGRNPRYYDFSELGGDCTNFASQVLYAGTGVMNFTPVMGWYYIDANNRSPSWTGVPFFYQFIVGNQGPGPFGKDAALSDLEPGDFVQLSFDGIKFSHTPVVVEVGRPATPDNVLVATHTYDSFGRPLSSYSAAFRRYIHILGYRRN